MSEPLYWEAGDMELLNDMMRKEISNQVKEAIELFVECMTVEFSMEKGVIGISVQSEDFEDNSLFVPLSEVNFVCLDDITWAEDIEDKYPEKFKQYVELFHHLKKEKP